MGTSLLPLCYYFIFFHIEANAKKRLMCMWALTHKGCGKGVVSNKQGFEPHGKSFINKIGARIYQIE